MPPLCAFKKLKTIFIMPAISIPKACKWCICLNTCLNVSRYLFFPPLLQQIRGLTLPKHRQTCKHHVCTLIYMHLHAHLQTGRSARGCLNGNGRGRWIEVVCGLSGLVLVEGMGTSGGSNKLHRCWLLRQIHILLNNLYIKYPPLAPPKPITVTHRRGGGPWSVRVSLYGLNTPPSSSSPHSVFLLKIRREVKLGMRGKSWNPPRDRWSHSSLHCMQNITCKTKKDIRPRQSTEQHQYHINCPSPHLARLQRFHNPRCLFMCEHYPERDHKSKMEIRAHRGFHCSCFTRLFLLVLPHDRGHDSGLQAVAEGERHHQESFHATPGWTRLPLLPRNEPWQRNKCTVNKEPIAASGVQLPEDTCMYRTQLCLRETYSW